eukprot:768162-Hanusia_phi.AAC.3
MAAAGKGKGTPTKGVGGGPFLSIRNKQIGKQRRDGQAGRTARGKQGKRLGGGVWLADVGRWPGSMGRGGVR